MRAAVQPFPFRGAAAAILLMLAACDQAGNEAFKARRTTYHFPPGDVVSITSSPYRVIRLSPADAAFDLVFDSRIDDQVDRNGHPKIFSINNGVLFAKTYTPTAAGVVACRHAVASMECGMALSVDGEHWSMLFPAALKSDVVGMAARARAYIEAAAVPETEGDAAS